MASRLVAGWQTALRKRPVVTNTIVYATFYTAAELSQQTFNKMYSMMVQNPSYASPTRTWPAFPKSAWLVTTILSKSAAITAMLLALLCSGSKPEKPEIDLASAGRIVAVGSSIYAPTLYYWYKYLDKKYVGTAVKTVATKVAADQFIVTPILLAGFYTSLGVLERKEDVFQELREKYWKSFIANQAFWIPGQTINFFFIPSHLRVVYVASVSFLWINVLCFIKRQKKTEEIIKEIN